MPTIVVLSGGDSDERSVSLRSGAAVVAALEQSGYDVISLDPAHRDDRYEQQITAADAVFPVLHGRGGEDGIVQGWLESRGVRYVGADAAVSAICFDKWRYKQALQALPTPAGATTVAVPRGEMVSADSFRASALITQPFVLKPADGGSSVDTYIVRDPLEFDAAAMSASFGRHEQMLLEELISGTEITVGVVLDAALPVIEIVPPVGAEFDYENKYNGATQELCPAQSISGVVQRQAQALALDIHRRLGVRDMSRTDMIIDGGGKLWVLETNTIPGMTAQSLLPKAAAAAGYSMPDLCSQLVTAALNRNTRHSETGLRTA